MADGEVLVVWLWSSPPKQVWVGLLEIDQDLLKLKLYGKFSHRADRIRGKRSVVLQVVDKSNELNIVQSGVKQVTLTAVVEQCRETGLYVGYVPGFAGA